MLRKIRQTALLGVAAFAFAGTAYSQNEQFVPMNGYWVGPYAAGGSGIFGGLIDYMQMINARDGGINGVNQGHLGEVRDRVQQRARCRVLRAHQEAGPDGSVARAPAFYRHHLFAHR